MKSFEQIVTHEQLKDGTLVVVEIPDIIKSPAMIIGLSTDSLVKNYIVQCLDNTLPNETYPYKAVSIPYSYLTPVNVRP